LQPEYALCVGGDSPHVPIGHYRGDFAYLKKSGDACVRIIEDVKGVDTPLSKWKRKHVQAQYGVTVQVVKMR
jgi:hypothetical protein